MPGDILLLECTPDFMDQADTLEKDLIVLNRQERDIPVSRKTLVASGIMLAVVLSATFNILPLVSAALLGLLAMLATRCCTPAKARSSVSGSTLRYLPRL